MMRISSMGSVADVFEMREDAPWEIQVRRIPPPMLPTPCRWQAASLVNQPSAIKNQIPHPSPIRHPPSDSLPCHPRPVPPSSCRPRMIQLIRDINEACRAAGRPALSFEFFPPKTEEGERALLEK